jgi:hypothetical protein
VYSGVHGVVFGGGHILDIVMVSGTSMALNIQEDVVAKRSGKSQAQGDRWCSENPNHSSISMKDSIPRFPCCHV